MIATCGGKVVYDDQNLFDKLSVELETVNKKLNEMNREVRRSKVFKRVAGVIAAIGAIGLASTDKAYAMEPSLAVANMNMPSLGGWLGEKIFHHFAPEGITADRSGTFAWQFSNYMSNTIFNTRDFFTNPSILHMWNVVFYMVLSMSTVIIGKKGFDMIKASALGTSHQGIPEFIVRLFASLIISFLSLNVISAVTDLSNIFANLLIVNFSKGQFITDSLQGLIEANIGAAFWLVGFVILFVILGITYWMRQLNLIFLGLMTPVASMAWVTDGGAMLGTLIKEIAVSLTTPIAQAATMSIGTTVLFEVTDKVGTGFGAFISSMLISLSTMVLMIITPAFLRKFIQGTVNPFKIASGLLMRTKGLPLHFLKMMK